VLDGTADYLAASRQLRDGVLAQLREANAAGTLSNRQYKLFTTVTVAWDEKKRVIYYAALQSKPKGSSEFCAEDLCELEAVKNGSSPGDLQFTEAMRPRDGEEVKICIRCQESYGLDQFKASGAQFEGGGRLDLEQNAQNPVAAEAEAEAEAEAQAEAEALAEGFAMGMEDE
jgi:hypothetical protein